MERQQQHMIFWGAGATAALGIRTTTAQTNFIARITGADSSKSLEERVDEALSPNNIAPWRSALHDLLMILGDQDSSYNDVNFIGDCVLDAMRRNWRDDGEPELRGRIAALRMTYDWPALKSVVRICPGSSSSRFKLNDLLNILDMHIPSGLGVRAPIPPGLSKDEQFFDVRRLIGAKNALLMILNALFYIDYRACLSSKPQLLEKYLNFAEILGERMQAKSSGLASKFRLDEPAYYKGDVSFVSLNYDPIALWVQFVANRKLNEFSQEAEPRGDRRPVHLFHDFGHMIPARRIEKGPADWPWYPMNEGAAQRLNEQTGNEPRIRLTKFLFPHGCLCWRECPSCGKLSSFHGDKWDLLSPNLFPPPPLRSFDPEPPPVLVSDKEREQRERGLIDARGCLHCGTMTYANQTQAIMQSSFKSSPPSFIEEIQRDLRATTMQAEHIILMGYSLPQDDVTYRAFFSASSQRHGRKIRCTIVGWELVDHPDWYTPGELKTRTFSSDHVVSAARDIFGEDNVRFYGGGFPQVVTDATGKISTILLEKLLDWESIASSP